MQQTIRTILIALISLTMLGGCGSGDTVARDAAEVRGANAAKHDIQQGQLELRGIGKEARWRTTYAQLLRAQFGVEYKSFGCVVTDDFVGETAGYNAAMKREIERRFGSGVLDRVAKEAQQSPPATRPAA